MKLVHNHGVHAFSRPPHLHRAGLAALLWWVATVVLLLLLLEVAAHALTT
jgi:hypothetical protein